MAVDLKHAFNRSGEARAISKLYISNDKNLDI
jgi:hypothetical protein